MKEKSFELLKELLLLQSAGGYGMFDDSINLAIDIYCLATGINREKFEKDLNEIKSFVWDNYCLTDLDDWDKRQSMYEKLINTLKGE